MKGTESMSELAYDPAGDFQQCGVSEMLHDVDIGGQGHIDEIRLQFYDLEQCSKEVVNTAVANEIFEFIEDFVHSA